MCAGVQAGRARTCAAGAWLPPHRRPSTPHPALCSMPYHQVPGSRQFIGNDAPFDGRKSATSAMMSDATLKLEEAMASSNFAGTESTVQRGSVSSRRSFGRPAPPRFTETQGQLQDDEAVSMFKRMDLNMDGHITHAELMRALLFTPEISRRLDRTGDAVHRNLVRKVVNREVKLPEDQTFSLHEWVDFCRSGSEREPKIERFIQAYNLQARVCTRTIATSTTTKYVCTHTHITSLYVWICLRTHTHTSTVVLTLPCQHMRPHV
jgi:hypothetical protein